MLDHAEDNLFQIEREMVAERHFNRVEAVLADCKETERMFEVMQRFKPNVVFHAAAYKHVPLMESNPLEAIRNNAIATRITAETAAAAKAERFVLISTDKAVTPQTVMGASKALAEWAVSAAGEMHAETRFVSVRFGNVLGSSGSVVPIFRRQIEQGGPVTVTHPEMTRFFMTIPEAVQLVIRAADTGNNPGRCLRPRHGRPDQDRRPRREHDQAGRPRTGEGHRDRVHRPASGREAPRRALRRRRETRNQPLRSGSCGRCVTSGSKRTGWKQTLDRLELVVRPETSRTWPKCSSGSSTPVRTFRSDPRKL
ncbi:MAG: polysaccharide biosynthesis protein [Solirubrobacterales bacterium]|nr:polysaccharide biosynthesis protein [Solirubrobacterales bacterium]